MNRVQRKTTRMRRGRGEVHRIDPRTRRRRSRSRRARANVLVILGHPRPGSLCGAIAQSFAEAAGDLGLEVKLLVLAKMEFDPHLRHAHAGEQELEPDLVQARRLIVRANHLVFVYPVWWGTMPALLKGFLDRILAPGFAFVEREEGRGFEGLLHGKSAHLLTTMDTAPAVVKYLQRSPGHRAFVTRTLGFCGIRPVRIRMYGPVNHSTEEDRLGWIEDARREARTLASGTLVSCEAVRAKLGSWGKAMRLQFYPMTWMAYTAGAVSMMPMPGVFHRPVYWLGYAVLFLIEVATVFINEVFDYESDRRNLSHGYFNGGSRTLVNGELSKRQLAIGVVIALGLSLGIVAMVIGRFSSWGGLLAMYLIAVILGFGYSVPPLKFSHRGAGEIVVAFTHSFLVFQAGALVMGGEIASGAIVLVALPVFFAVMPSIILAGIPDREADESIGKGTLAVRLGVHGAMGLALAATVAAMVLLPLVSVLDAVSPPTQWVLAAPLLHGVALVGGLGVARNKIARGGRPRLDGLIVLSLGFILWFLLLPLVFPGVR